MTLLCSYLDDLFLFFILFIFIYFFKDFIYLFMKDRERERERRRDTGRGRSRLHAPGARYGIRFRVSRIAPWAKGRRQTAAPPRDPPASDSYIQALLTLYIFSAATPGRLWSNSGGLHQGSVLSQERTGQEGAPGTGLGTSNPMVQGLQGSSNCLAGPRGRFQDRRVSR